MGLITKEVEVVLSSNNIKHFENKGYELFRKKDKRGRVRISKGTTIIIKVEDLSNGSHVKVDCECDGCKKKLKNIIWQTYLRYVKEDGTYYCHKCAIAGFKKWIDFEQWCIENNRKDLLKYIINKNDINKYSYGSRKLIPMKCPKCGYIKNNVSINNLRHQGFSCPKCGDGISYLNKFVRNFLDQLNENYIPEFSSKDLNSKKYDNYLIDYNEIWEVHGLQHYEDKFNTYGKNAKSLKEEQENDKLKKELVEQNDLKYIIIDARYSDMEYIKNSLINLPEIQRYDLSKVDWNKCHEFAIDSLVKVVCDLWNNGIKSAKEISKLMKLSLNTITRYLKQGAKLSWCDYDPIKIKSEVGKINGRKSNKPVIQLSLTGEYIAEYKSAIEIKRKLGICNSHISSCCKRKQKTCCDFKWMYKEDYEKYIEQQNKSA